MDCGYKILCGVTAGLLIFSQCSAWADEAVLPPAAWPASHYAELWSRSPFITATPEEAPESPQYYLCGIAQLEGVSYACLVDKTRNEHFLLSTDVPVRGLTLVSISHGSGASGGQAVVRASGASITLRLDDRSGPTPALATSRDVPTMDAANFHRYPTRMGTPSK